jgi:hypothetical protein
VFQMFSLMFLWKVLKTSKLTRVKQLSLDWTFTKTMQFFKRLFHSSHSEFKALMVKQHQLTNCQKGCCKLHDNYWAASRQNQQSVFATDHIMKWISTLFRLLKHYNLNRITNISLKVSTLCPRNEYYFPSLQRISMSFIAF